MLTFPLAMHFLDFARIFEDRAHHFVFMNPGTRARDLANCTYSLRETGQSLLLTQNIPPGVPKETFCPYLPVEVLADDLGIYSVIPRLALALGIPTYWARDLFFSLFIFLAYLGGIWGWRKLSRSRAAQSVGLLAMTLGAILSLYTFDVYCMAFVMSSFVPWFFVFQKRLESNAIFIFLPFFGLMAGISHVFRSHSATPVLLLAGAIFLTELKKGTQRHRRKLLSALALGSLSFCLPFLAKNALIHSRDHWLEAHGCPVRPWLADRHNYWHNLFVGLGYLENNPYGIKFEDGTAIELFHLNPKIPFPEYEKFLRKKLSEMAWERPMFFVQTYLAKFAEGLMRGLLFWAPALWVLYRNSRRKRMGALSVRLAWGGALSFSLLPSLIALPIPIYLLSFYSMGLAFTCWVFVLGPAGKKSG